MKTSLYLLFITFLLTYISCKDVKIPSPVHADTQIEQNDNLTLEEIDDAFKPNKGRDVWQRPGKVLDLLGNIEGKTVADIGAGTCLLYTSPSPRDRQKSRMPSSA